MQTERQSAPFQDRRIVVPEVKLPGETAHCPCAHATIIRDGRAGGHMQLATLLEPWPTSLIWLTCDEQTATPAPARQ